MSNTADEAWAEWRAYTDAVDEEEELVRGIIEATAREIAREEIQRLTHSDAHRRLEARVAALVSRVDRLYDMQDEDPQAEQERESANRCLDCGEDTGAVEYSFCLDCDMTRAREAQELAAQKGEQGPPAPSEGEEGEVDEDMPPVVRYLLGSGPFDGLWYGDDPPQGVGRYWWRRSLRETVQRLQRERDKLKAKVFRLHERLDSRARIMTVRLERILDLEAENARLKREREAYADPRNWMPLSARYIGPSDSTEAEQDDFEQYADEAVREIARIMDDSTEADEGESVEGEVCGSWYIGLGGRGSPWPEGTRVRITKLPETQEDDDGTE